MTAAASVPADAQPVVTGGLVNVTVVDVASGNTIQALNGVTLQVAAAVCGVSVQALVVDLGPDGFVSDCDNSQTTETTVTQRRR